MPLANSTNLDDLIKAIVPIRDELLAIHDSLPFPFERLTPDFVPSARNLLHYVALRRHDLRNLQDRLAELGLSSLGRSEACTLANLQSVLRMIRLAAGQPNEPLLVDAIGHAEGRQLLQSHTHTLLGPLPMGRQVRIMVTMPGDGASDYGLIRDLVRDGMDCMRINCAHDTATDWKRMIDHLRQAENELGKKCRVLMDLGGPKLRTGLLPPGPRVLKYRPRRDAHGKVLSDAAVWLTPRETPKPPPQPADAVIPVPCEWLRGLKLGDRIRFRDARGAKRSMTVTGVTTDGCWTAASRTAYVVDGTSFRLSRKSRNGRPAMKAAVTIEGIPEKPTRLPLKEGDSLILTRTAHVGSLASEDLATGQSLPARISCTLPEVFHDVKAGEPIYFDDGKIGGTIREVKSDHLLVEITQTGPAGAWLGADKGINLPETDIRLPALTKKDLKDLRFIAAHADMVGYSFVRDAEDVAQLHDQLKKCGGEMLGIILKIETRRAFEHLPELLLAAMRGPSVGVMIARGDLAVECGFERLAEVQEEILWVCEAAHVPVIWATQVLENLAKTGRPSRAEITDAAMGERAECVMLNKGPHIREAVRLLSGILLRMEGHQHKKSAMLRRLRLAHLFGAGSQIDSAASQTNDTATK